MSEKKIFCFNCGLGLEMDILPIFNGKNNNNITINSGNVNNCPNCDVQFLNYRDKTMSSGPCGHWGPLISNYCMTCRMPFNKIIYNLSIFCKEMPIILDEDPSDILEKRENYKGPQIDNYSEERIDDLSMQPRGMRIDKEYCTFDKLVDRFIKFPSKSHININDEILSASNSDILTLAPYEDVFINISRIGLNKYVWKYCKIPDC